MAQIRWTEPAISDLHEIAQYIALDNLKAAKKLVRDVMQSVKRLNQFPESGKIPEELPDMSYREIIVGPCRVFYRYDGKFVFVLYVMRSERMLRQFLLEGRNSNS